MKTTVIIFIALFILSCEKDEKENLKINKSFASFNLEKIYGSVEDIDGNNYRTIQIGNQVWMAENLRTIKFSNGESIKYISNKSEIKTTTYSAYMNCNNSLNIDTIESYGRLYNWSCIIDNRNIAPEGWHVATIKDWDELANYLGGYEVAGRKIKESGSSHWIINMNDANNESGFTALPGWFGEEYYGEYAYWWAKNDKATSIMAMSNRGRLYKSGNGESSFYAVRCVKNN